MVTPNRLRADEMRTIWRRVTWAGLLGTTYGLFCIMGAPRTEFLRTLGATPRHFGWIQGLASAALAFQLLGGALGNRLRHRKPLWMILAITHRLLFLGVIGIALLRLDAYIAIPLIILVFFLHDAFSQTATPLWFSWMADLVPKESMSHHWAVRQRFITLFNIVSMLVLAVGFGYFEQIDRVVEGYALFVVVGVVLGVIDILLFRNIPEPDYETDAETRLSETVLQPLRDKEYRGYLCFSAYWNFAVSLSAPFFLVFMLEVIFPTWAQHKVFVVQVLGIASALGAVLFSKFWGLLCDSYGYRPVLKILMGIKVLPPLFFALAPRNPAWAVPYFAIFFFLDGIANGGMILAMQMPMLKFTPRKNRSMYIAASSFFAVGIAGCIGPIIAGQTIDWVNAMHPVVANVAAQGYLVMFAMSFMLRLGAFQVARLLHDPHALPTRLVLKNMFQRSSIEAFRHVEVLHGSQSVTARLDAVKKLRDLKSPLGIGELVQALVDEEPEVREASAEALGVIGMSQAVEPLAAALFDADSGIQSPAAKALGEIGCVDSLKALLRNVSNQDAHAKIETIKALAQIGDEAAVLPLIALFQDVEDERIRKHIVEALGTLTATDNTDVVLSLLRGRRPVRNTLQGTRQPA